MLVGCSAVLGVAPCCGFPPGKPILIPFPFPRSWDDAWPWHTVDGMMPSEGFSLGCCGPEVVCMHGSALQHVGTQGCIEMHRDTLPSRCGRGHGWGPAAHPSLFRAESIPIGWSESQRTPELRGWPGHPGSPLHNSACRVDFFSPPLCFLLFPSSFRVSAVNYICLSAPAANLLSLSGKQEVRKQR